MENWALNNGGHLLFGAAPFVGNGIIESIL